jgi:hypothetical protein
MAMSSRNMQLKKTVHIEQGACKSDLSINKGGIRSIRGKKLQAFCCVMWVDTTCLCESENTRIVVLRTVQYLCEYPKRNSVWK